MQQLIENFDKLDVNQGNVFDVYAQIFFILSGFGGGYGDVVFL